MSQMVSPRKTSSALSQMSNTSVCNLNPKNAKSCESLYSNCSKGSATMVYGRKPTSGADAKNLCMRQPAIIPATNEVRKRVLSARMLRMKTYQNQLANAQQTIAELAQENRMLRTLHKRQDTALSKYENTNAELPQLLHSHAEELRVWQTKYRNLQAITKDLEQKLKQKEAIILTISDQNKYYIQLNKDKNLDDRHKLTEKLQALESRLVEKENDIKMMARKMQLESKQAKQQLISEQKKTKEAHMKLEKARMEIIGYRRIEELQLQEKFNMNLRRQKPPPPSLGGDDRDNKPIEKHNLTYNQAADDEADETDTPSSHRSSHSNHTVTTRSSRTNKKLNLLNNNEYLSPRPMEQTLSKIPKKSVAIVHRSDQGDGDASIVATATEQNKESFLPSLEPQKSENPSTEYEDDYEHDEDEDGDEEEYQVNSQDFNYDESIGEGETGRFINNIDKNLTDSDSYDQKNMDFYKESETSEIPSAGKKIRMKEEISCIRKQITEDYKEREAFLDTFCRQATLKDDTAKKRNRTTNAHIVPTNRKNKLLAALKAIDDNEGDN